MKLEKFAKAGLRSIALAWCGLAVLTGAEESPPKVTFADHVVPVLEDACLSCHNPDQAKGGLDLTSFAAAMNGGSGGSIVQAGSPDRSRLFTLASHAEEPHMPPNKPKITPAQLDVLKRWIEDGLLEKKGSKAQKAAANPLTAAVQAAGERPKEPAMPKHLLLEPEVVTSRGTAVTALACSPWAPLVAIGGQKQVLLYRTDTLELAGVLGFAEGFPEALAFSRNGALLLAGGGRGGKSGKAVAWDVKTGQRVVEVGREFDTALAADLSPDHRLVALGGPGRNIKVFDAQSGEQLRSIKKHPDWLLKLRFSPDGVLFASGGRNGEIVVWESDTGIEFYELADHQKPITGLSWRGDSNILAASSEDGAVSLWEMQNGKQIKKWAAHPGGATSVQFSPDGSLLVSGGRDRSLKLWDLNGGLKREIKGGGDVITSATFSHDGKRLISGDFQGEIKVWDPATGAQLGKLLGNPPSIDGQLGSAEQQAKAAEARLPELEKAAVAASAAWADAAKKLEAAKQQLAEATQGQGAAGQAVKRAEQALTEASGKMKAADQAQQSARKAAEMAKANAEKNRVQLEARRASLADLERKLASLPQELSAMDLQLAEAGPRFEQTAQARAAAAKAVQQAQFERDQLPGNPGLEAKLSSARKSLEAAETTCRQAEAAQKELAAKRLALAKALAQLPQARDEERRQVKAGELLLAQQPSLTADAEHRVAEADARVVQARKLEQEGKAALEEAKKALAVRQSALKPREEAVKAAAASVAQLQPKESAAKAALAQAGRDLAFLQYLVQKWQAAKVNVQLHARTEELAKARDHCAKLQDKAKAATVAHDAAAKALAQAQQDLQKAREVVKQSTATADSAADRVVESGLKVVAARLADSARSESIAAQGKASEKDLDSTASRLKQTMAELAQATKTAKETPAIIEERTRVRDAKQSEMTQALEMARLDEKKVEEQAKLVDDLRKRYEGLYREWPQ